MARHVLMFVFMDYVQTGLIAYSIHCQVEMGSQQNQQIAKLCVARVDHAWFAICDITYVY